MFKRIQSPQNPTIKSASKLRTARGRQQQNRIVIDGTREVQRALQCGIEIETVFLPSSPESDETIEAQFDWLLSDSNKAVFNVYAVDMRAFEKVSFGNRMEAVAIAKTPERRLEQLNLTKPATIAVLECIEKPGNVGAVLRSADGAGLDAVVLVDCISDLFNPNAIRSSLGTIFALPIAETTFDEFRAWQDKNDVTCLLAKCDVGAYSFDDDRLYSSLADSSLAIVLGSESEGLTTRWDGIERSQNVTIPMMGIADSLNISAAAAVFFYVIRGKRRTESAGSC